MKLLYHDLVHLDTFYLARIMPTVEALDCAVRVTTLFKNE